MAKSARGLAAPQASASNRKLAAGLLKLADQLSRELAEIDFSPVTNWVYNPYQYARDAHRLYLEKYAQPTAVNVFLGMNPGPWGMAQTGVPFGEVSMVRDWLQITPRIEKPAVEHPKRPVVGLECTRSEVSGRRLWGFFREHFKTPDAFFAHNFVLNYCPLVFMDPGGKNLTPDKFPKSVREQMQLACDRHLLGSLSWINPRRLIGVGNYAFEALRRVTVGQSGLEDAVITKILHPSPASPASNRGWDAAVLGELQACGVLKST